MLLFTANITKIRSAYLAPRNKEDFHGLLSCTTPPVSEEFAEVSLTSAESLAEFLLPSVACDFEHWVNWWSPPPGDHTDFPAITKNTVDKEWLYTLLSISSPWQLRRLIRTQMLFLQTC